MAYRVIAGRLSDAAASNTMVDTRRASRSRTAAQYHPSGGAAITGRISWTMFECAADRSRAANTVVGASDEIRSGPRITPVTRASSGGATILARASASASRVELPCAQGRPFRCGSSARNRYGALHVEVLFSSGWGRRSSAVPALRQIFRPLSSNPYPPSPSLLNNPGAPQARIPVPHQDGLSTPARATGPRR